ncbi:unnamed protein product [Leptidea sinapis]|uniref:FP protein N-terminal domain-containing protein n=1 Tax=Leptidea sinapis TaxID=189913 RepID=A0A5E4PPV9_9NEOP|nr:unnamed protein product [Leptidea sinapis]
MEKKLEDISEAVDFYTEQYQEMVKFKAESEKKIKSLEQRNVYLDKCNKALEERVLDMEQGVKASNVEIVGLEKQENEITTEAVKRIAQKLKLDPNNIEDAFRVGREKPNDKKPQPIIVKLKSLLEFAHFTRDSSKSLNVILFPCKDMGVNTSKLLFPKAGEWLTTSLPCIFVIDIVDILEIDDKGIVEVDGKEVPSCNNSRAKSKGKFTSLSGIDNAFGDYAISEDSLAAGWVLEKVRTLKGFVVIAISKSSMVGIIVGVIEIESALPY